MKEHDYWLISEDLRLRACVQHAGFRVQGLSSPGVTLSGPRLGVCSLGFQFRWFMNPSGIIDGTSSVIARTLKADMIC